MRAEIGVHKLIRGDFFEVAGSLPAASVLITDPPFEYYTRDWIARYIDAVPDHAHCLVFSKQPHTHRVNYWMEELSDLDYLTEYIWYFTDGASFRDRHKPLMHHETIAVFTRDKSQIDMERMREPQRTPDAKRKYSTNKHRGKKGKDVFWEPHPDGSWRSSVIPIQRAMTGELVSSDLPVGVKPVKLLYELLQGFTGVPGLTVIDPFMGSGTTGIACARLGVPFIGVEQDDKTFELALQRITLANDDLFNSTGE